MVFSEKDINAAASAPVTEIVEEEASRRKMCWIIGGAAATLGLVAVAIAVILIYD